MANLGNKAIILNSIILYIRLFITTILGLFTTRYALQALGNINYGLFTVLGSVISFIAIINTIMVSTSNRFLAVAIGRGNQEEVNEQFNISFIIHIFVAIITLFIAVPIGNWYIQNLLNYDGSLDTAQYVFYFSVVGSIFSFIGVPFNGLLMAKEKFLVFCSTESICSLLKLILALFVLNFGREKLYMYALGMGLITVLPTIVYWIYCRKKYYSIVEFKVSRNYYKYKEVLLFSVWVGYGAIAFIAKNQFAAVLVNKFFSTLVNTALGISNTVNALLSMVGNAVIQPMAPQITKSYAAGDMTRCIDLLVMSTKFGYLVMFVVAVPLLTNMEWILELWLGQVPLYTVSFSKLLLIDSLIIALNNGISSLIFASGKIKSYQIIVNTLRLFAIIVAYFILKIGFPPESLLLCYIVFSCIIFFVMQFILKVTLNFDNRILFKKSYLPSCLVTVTFLPILFLGTFIHPVVYMALSLLYSLFLIYVFGLAKRERRIVLLKLKELL